MLVKIKERSWLAGLAAAKLRSSKVAMVIGNTIHLHNTSKEEFIADTKWVCHELKHVQQYKQYGIPVFLFRYLIESIRKGYYNNRFEKEARESECDVALMKEFRIGEW